MELFMSFLNQRFTETLKRCFASDDEIQIELFFINFIIQK
jgi:hypothetical protein